MGSPWLGSPKDRRSQGPLSGRRMRAGAPSPVPRLSPPRTRPPPASGRTQPLGWGAPPRGQIASAASDRGARAGVIQRGLLVLDGFRESLHRLPSHSGCCSYGRALHCRPGQSARRSHRRQSSSPRPITTQSRRDVWPLDRTLQPNCAGSPARAHGRSGSRPALRTR